jgi:integrase/recombinase XerD
MSRSFRTYRDRAGIGRPVTFHGLRHGFASHLAAKGKSAWVIQAACRHSSVTVSQVYVSLANQTLKRELEDVFD